ncbi:MAG: dephospho-CoA kinase [Bacteroidia bacterium]|nr:dephospho-CoA kinase [Bacteroidia bacterium]MDW8347056.1 dephospho-CoA kinase [Bacteroidia bacterium]
MVRVIGITGGIGSGKTTVCKWFEDRSAPVYNADVQAKWLMNHDLNLRSKLITHFGSDIYENNTLNTAKLASIVFQDSNQLATLNKLVHPVVFEHFESWKQQYKHLPFVLKEAALMYETESYLQTDAIVVIYAPMKVRLERACKRDKTEPETILARMQKQLPEDHKLHKADYVIYNDSIHELVPQLEGLEKWIYKQC